MNHYPRYPKYKDSGVEWLGQVPEHWEIARIKRVASLRAERCTNVPEGWQYVGLEDVEPGTGRFHPTDSDSRQKEDSTVGVFRPGDVLYGKLRPYLKKTIVGDSDGVCSTEFLVLQPKSVMAQWLHQWLLTTEVTQQIEAGCEGTKMPRADWEHIGSIPVPYPSLSEQGETIAALDRETSRIDALIAKKTRFIELLQEKRAALITHVVTKGLDPEVKMKDSGVEWIGEIPDHWQIVQLGKIASARCDGPFGSGLKSEHYQPSGVRVIRLQNIGWATFKDDDSAFISHEHWREVLGSGHAVLPNDVLIAGLGDENNLLGRACVAPSTLGEAIVKADCYRFRLHEDKAFATFVALSLSATARAECGYMAVGATRDRLTLGLASIRRIPLPPLDEQVQIMGVLERASTRIDMLTKRIERSIDLLKERRSALITAVVTGKIDVRGWVPNAMPKTHDLKGANT